MADARFCVEYAKTGRSGCKKCKAKIDKGACRIGKITANPFSDDGGDMKVWYHSQCIFETFKRARATTKRIETPADLEGFADLEDKDKDKIKELIKDSVPKPKSPSKTKPKKTSSEKKPPPPAAKPPPSQMGASPSKKPAPTSHDQETANEGDSSNEDVDTAAASGMDASTPDNSFCQFRRLCQDLEKEPSYNAKTKIVSDYIKFGNSGKGFTGNVYLLTKLLLPGTVKRVYNLQSKQIVNVLSRVLETDLDDMVEDLEQGDVAETARKFFEQSQAHRPATKSTLTLSEVDTFLDHLAHMTKEDDQKRVMTKIVRRCTADDLKYIIRLIKRDLRINAGAKHILDALDSNAYAAFQVSHDLKDVVDRVLSRDGGDSEAAAAKPGLSKALSIRLSLMTAVKPMLAEACRSVAKAMKKCPNGMFAEVKYDGERVQVHKQGDQFQYFSRSLKPVQAHKVAQVKDFIPQACPHGDSMILDSEVLLVDNKTGDPLPFGTLGIHKKTAFKDATCCLFVFDILYFNGRSLLDEPIIERRKILEKNLTEVKNHIMLAEQTLVRKPDELSGLITKVIKQGLEGLVLKDTRSIYEPGKRHWLKVKKDYLEGGSMADTADLVVLGAYYGTGNKGGMMSVFLMGVYDESCDKFRTVCKCGNGHDDATIQRLQTELDVVKISKNASMVPAWLLVNKTLVPDLVVADPKAAPVWEITGAEFSKSTTHTASGISIRFPRVTRIRDDKDWSTATELQRLKTLFTTSKENIDIKLSGTKDDDNGDEDGSDDDEMDVVSDQVPPSRKRGSSSGDKAVDVPRKKTKPSNKPSPTKSPSKPSATKSPAKTPPSKPSPTVSKGSAATSSPAKVGTKPSCKYGVKCYQKSKQHKEQFVHPQDSDSSMAASSVPGPLLDLFSGMKFLLDPSLSDAKELTRYLIAYDGEVLKDYDSSNATHIITGSKSFAEDLDTSDSVLVLKPEWVRDSLKRKRLVLPNKYKL